MLAREPDHFGTRIDRLDREPAGPQGDGQAAGTATHLEYACALCEGQIADPVQHQALAGPVHVAGQRVVRVHVVPPGGVAVEEPEEPASLFPFGFHPRDVA